ncbi:MAG: carboxypeptidase-like regulatory domain-containing protein [Opitutales bacterium]|nr:carboxypeptidase-like regulatory domain-containing protein [Opitutales bacterium]
MKKLLLKLASFSLLTTQFLLAQVPEKNGEDLAPTSLAGLEVEMHEIADLISGGTYDYGVLNETFGEREVSAYDSDSQQIESKPYIYEKLGPDSARIILQGTGLDEKEINITFIDKNYAKGRWLEVDGGETYSGTLSFRIIDSTTTSLEEDYTDNQTNRKEIIVSPKSMDGWVLRLEINAADGEDVDILSFSAGQATESDEEGGTSEQLGSYTYENISDSQVSVTLNKPESGGAPTVLTLDFTSNTGQYDDFVNLDPTEVDSSFEPTDVPGQYKDLIGSGTLTFSVISSPSTREPIGSGTETNQGTIDEGDETDGEGEPIAPRNDGEVFAPASLAGYQVEIHEIENLGNGETKDYGMDTKNFGESEVSQFYSDSNQTEFNRYEYSVEDSNNATLTIFHGTPNDTTVINLTFTRSGYGEGTWLEREESGTFEGTLTFRILDNSDQTGEVDYSNGSGTESDLVKDAGEYPATVEEALVDFDAQTYLEMNPDLKEVFGDDLNAAINHFTSAGFLEGRIYSGSVDQGKNEGDPAEEGADSDDTMQQDEKKPEMETVPMSEVEEFVNLVKKDKLHYETSNVVFAEKAYDAKDAAKFIYRINLDSGVSIILDKNGSFLHSENTDDFAYSEMEEISESQFPNKIKDAIELAIPGSKIVKLEKEFSLELPENPEQAREFIYLAVIEKDSEKLELRLDINAKIHLITNYEESDFEQNEWKPFELPPIAVSYLSGKYVEGTIGIPYFADQRPAMNGQGMEFVAYLENGTEVIFDVDGNFSREFDPWKAFEENLDAGLKFDASRSSWGEGDSRSVFIENATSGTSAAYVHISKVEDNSSISYDRQIEGMKEMSYQISLLNQEVINSSPTLNDLELNNTNLPAGTKLNLTFTYEMGPPRYFLVSGAKVSAFKHRLPDYGKAGSFTISAETVAPVASASNPGGSIGSTFGIVVEMSGDRFYEGTIFETNIVCLDLSSAEFSSPWDPVASFTLNGKSGTDTAVRAYIPRKLLSDYYGLMNPNMVKAALVDSNGSLSFLNGSVEGENDGVGSNFNRKPHKGVDDREIEDFSLLDSSTLANNEFHLGDDDFGITDQLSLHQGNQGNTYPENDNLPITEGTTESEIIENSDSLVTEDQNLPIEDSAVEHITDTIETSAARRTATINAINSKFDFDGNQFGDSLLEISFTANVFPGEVQIGDPYIDPFASLDESSFGSVSGSVRTTEGITLKEYNIWFFKAPEAGGDLYGGDPVFFDFEIAEDGSYVAKLPAGNYHAEASAYDFETDTPYKPTLALDGSGEIIIFEIVDSSSQYTQDFALEAEFRMSFEMANISGLVTKSGGGKVQDVFFELFPMENGQRATDYPVHSFSIDRDGKIIGEAPTGIFEIEVFSHDNSLHLSGNKQITVVLGEENDLGTIELEERALVTVSGTIKDSSDGPIWADILFVNPNDSEDIFWPMPNEIAYELQEGEFSVQIPEGDYLVKAERYDGLYISKMYDGDSNGTADILKITPNFSDQINFVLESRPTATVSIKLVDANTSEPIKYAFFDFFDAEDEFGSMVFPDIGIVDFESDTFDGTYNLKVPGGTYKMSVAADGYEHMFRSLDESGNTVWTTTTWDQGSSLTLVDGNSTDLGTIQMNGFKTSDAERFGFKWMEEGVESVGYSIKGKVKTNKGSDVPKARIIAHTQDYLFWMDHFVSRADGSFELKNLPAGNWMVFAEPPFDSDAFLGFRESLPVAVNLTDSNKTAVDLILQGSNVSGRILYPAKDAKTGVKKDKSLSNVFVWAYRDENGDGEPDYDEEIRLGNATLSEAYGDTDEDGFFSFYLAEAGKYSIRLELPGELSTLSPPPIQFSLRNPSDDLKLGNSIKIDWKSDVKATQFDIERKASKESSYKSLFSSDSNNSKWTKPSAQMKSFVDTTIKTGETYSYRVTAETSKGKVTLDSSKVRVSSPMIYLAPPSKSVTGRVADGNGSVISGAEIVAWREEGEGWSSALSGDDGKFELTTGPGKWEITIYRPMDTKVDWIYDQQPKRISFKKDESLESQEVNFSVSRMAGGKIVGSIAIPEGKTASELAKYVFIDAFNPKGEGNWANPDSSGNFEIPLQPGDYELSIWVDPTLKGIGSPPFQIVRVGSSSVDIGQISLTTRSQTVVGSVKTNQSKALPNVEVWAWSEEGGWVSDTTNTNGEYSLSVSPGRWEIGYDLPMAADGSEPPYLSQPPKRIKVNQNDSNKTMDFVLKEAGAKIKGVVYGSSGSPVSNLDAWVFAKDIGGTSAQDEFIDIVAEVPINSRGEFVFPSVPGTYSVGLWLPPGSGFVPPAEKVFLIEETNGTSVIKDGNGSVISQVTFNLTANDAVIEGSFKLNNSLLSGLTGEVYAIRADGEDGWVSTPIEDNGTYSLLLSPGSWMIDYYIENDTQTRNLPSQPAEPTPATAIKGQSVTQDFALVSATAKIAGNVLYEANSSTVTDSTLYVWAYREGTASTSEYWNEVESDENGSFSISVLPGGNYEVGAYLSQSLRDGGYLDPSILNASVVSGNVSDLNLTISKPSTLNFISGTISKSTNEVIEGASVYAWADDGREIDTISDSNGSFKLTVPSGVVWHVGAEYGEIDENGTEALFFLKNEMDVDLKSVDSISGLNLSLTQPDFEVPNGSSNTFNPSSDFVTKLPDGTELTIPGGASNVSADVTSVRLVITPTAKGLSKSATEKPADYGYSLELFDNNGKQVEGNFKKDVILSIPVDLNASIKNGMDVNNVQAMYYSSTKDAWEKAKTSTWDKNNSKLSLTTDHFTTFAAVSAPDVSDLVKNIAKVDSTAYGDWYNLPWLGYFYDASSGWVYHTELGWMYSKEESNGNFWLYEAELGWLWTGPSYFEASSDNKAFLYSVSDAGWLYFKLDGGLKKFYRYSDQKWILSNRTETSKP